MNKLKQFIVNIGMVLLVLTCVFTAIYLVASFISWEWCKLPNPKEWNPVNIRIGILVILVAALIFPNSDDSDTGPL